MARSCCFVVAVCFLALLALGLGPVAVAAKKGEEDPKECEVCVSVLDKVDELLVEKKDKRNKDKIEAAIDEFCNGRINSKDDKMCYYFKPIKKHISQPFSLGLPKLK